MTTVAIMQPYFYPYAGYFRLFARADLFVVYDCVQFPRRGWVHRNRLTGADGQLQWLTLLLQQGVQHGQQKSRCLAAAGLARNHQVGKTAALAQTLHGLGDGGCLHRGGLGKPEVCHCLEEFGG